jgi:hypothetical protein
MLPLRPTVRQLSPLGGTRPRHPCPHRRRLRARIALLAAATLVALIAIPVAAWGAEWRDGDVFVGLNTGKYNVYANSGTLKETIDTGSGGFAVDCAFDRSGVLHTTAFSASKLVRFLGPDPHAKLTDVATGTFPESVSFARDGTYLVGHQSNPLSLRKFTGAGTPSGTFSPAFAATMIDLSADQKTVFYTSQSGGGRTQIHRFDIAANADRPDFAVLGGTDLARDLKLLPPGDGSGGAIVAQSKVIKRLDGAGRLVKTYDAPGEDSWFGIALDPDGRSFWAQSNTPGSVFRFDIESGVVDRGPLPSAAGAFGICAAGTRTAALDNAAPSVDISSPAEGATFVQGSTVRAAFTCRDDAFGTGIRSCAAPVGPGAAIDTASPGRKSFTVDAADVAGNTARRTTTYTVVAPPPPPPPPPAVVIAPPTPRITVTLTFGFDEPGREFTRLNALNVTGIPRGSKLQVTCKAPRRAKCPVKRFTKRNARGRVNVKPFRKRFAAGTVIDARVTKQGTIGAVKLLRINRKRDPTLVVRCLPLGSKRPQRRC